MMANRVRMLDLPETQVQGTIIQSPQPPTGGAKCSLSPEYMR